jgi:hypothetical protein
MGNSLEIDFPQSYPSLESRARKEIAQSSTFVGSNPSPASMNSQTFTFKTKRCRIAPMGAIKFRANSYNPEELNGKVAVVTGAAAGIGKATLMVLAQSGAAVIGLDQDTNGLTQVLGWSKSKSLKVETFQCDVSNQQKLRDAFKFADSTFGACDILVAAAGIGLYKDFLGISEEEIDRVLDVNIKGVLFSM